jgi:hypothetical protein
MDNFKQSKTFYYVAIVVFAFSLAVAVFAPTTFVQNLATIPLVVSLVGALFQLMRDESAHTRSLLAIDYANQFALGASSHMAKVAFDKHVEFCEEYVNEAISTMRTIGENGATKKAMTHAQNFVKIREKYAVWITSQIENDLFPFEMALHHMGVSAIQVENLDSRQSEALRLKHLNRMYELLAKITNSKEWEGKELTDELAISTLIKRLRTILGTEELSRMRQKLTSKALKGIADST